MGDKEKETAQSRGNRSHIHTGLGAHRFTAENSHQHISLCRQNDRDIHIREHSELLKIDTRVPGEGKKCSRQEQREECFFMLEVYEHCPG